MRDMQKPAATIDQPPRKPERKALQAGPFSPWLHASP
jgi:hypothetical protein